MILNPQKSYEYYWKKIIENNFNYSTAEELFLYRVSAFVKLGSNNNSEYEIAKEFLFKTMQLSTDHSWLSYQAAFVKTVEHFDFPEITAHRSDENLYAVAYKINYRTSIKTDYIYEIAFFQKDVDDKLIFTYKYNLIDLYKLFSTAAVDTKNRLRQLGDPVLAKAGKVVQENETELYRQIKIAKETLIDTGGVGIAANQCAEIAEPLRFALVGIDYTNPEHAIKALTRYPNVLFPKMIACINPIVVSASKDETLFLEGCLSFKGVARGSVSRPKEITVTYQQIDGSYATKTFKNIDAVVMQHEIDHILNGLVFVEKIIEELNQSQIETLIKIVKSINIPSFHPVETTAFQTPLPIFTRDLNNKIIFDESEATKILSSTQKNALEGLEALLIKKLDTFSNRNNA